jgi:protein-ribulosamine 3-kinase
VSFLKQGPPERADAFAAEADGLDALRPHIRVPQVLAHGVKDGRAFIRLEYLALARSGDYAALARMLASLHRQAGPRFGWHRDNYIGHSPQANAWHDHWAEFFIERRLRPQALRAGIELPPVKLLENHHPQPSLLHGDLWSGNAGFTAEGPVVFDPAVYYGDREADLAMTELFGGFPDEFYAAYDEAWPLERGYETRKHLYNLYHLLNHLNLFGPGYLAQVNATLGLLRRAL